MYQKLPNDQISNLYNIKLANKTRKLIHLDLKLENIKGKITLINQINVAKESYYQTSFFIILDHKKVKKRKMKIEIGIYENGERIETTNAIFLAPAH
jgi:hypothetical protein